MEKRIAGSDVRLMPNAAPTIEKQGRHKILKGYCCLFDTPYSMWAPSVGNFIEKVGRSAFDNTDFSDVACIFNHNPDNILGRTSSGTMQIGVDNVGLWYEVKLPKGPRGQDMTEALQRKDISQSSWGFRLAPDGDTWERDAAGRPVRTLTAVAELYDTSPVTFPANGATSAAIVGEESQRSIETFVRKSNTLEDDLLAAEQTAVFEQMQKELIKEQARQAERALGEAEANLIDYEIQKEMEKPLLELRRQRAQRQTAQIDNLLREIDAVMSEYD